MKNKQTKHTIYRRVYDFIGVICYMSHVHNIYYVQCVPKNGITTLNDDNNVPSRLKENQSTSCFKNIIFDFGSLRQKEHEHTRTLMTYITSFI